MHMKANFIRVRRLPIFRSPSRRGLVAQLFSLAVIVTIQIIQVPVFIGVLGPAKYGSYLVLIAIPSALTLADFGLLGVTATRMLALLAHGKYSEATVLSRFTNSFVMIATSLILVAVSIATWSFDVSQHDVGLAESRAIIQFYSIYAVLSVYSSSFEAAMRAAGSYPAAWIRLSVMRLIDFVVGAVLLIWTGGIVVSIIGMLLSRVIGLLLLRRQVKRIAPWASWKFVFPRASMAPGLLKPTLGSIALPIGNAFVNQGIVLAVSAALGPVAVVVFTSVRTMINVLRQLTNAITNSTMPSLTQLLSHRDLTGARKALKHTALMVGIVVILGGVGLVTLGPWILGIWTHGQVSAPPGFIAMLVLQSLVESAWLVLSLWFYAQNRHFGYSVVYVLSSGACVLLLFSLRPTSLISVALFLMASSAIVLIWVTIALMNEARDDNPSTSVQK